MTEIEITTKSGTKYTFYRTKNDVNGNPRYIVHFLDLGLSVHQALNRYKPGRGLSRYTGQDFGGGYVFQSYNLQHSAEFFESEGLKRQ